MRDPGFVAAFNRAAPRYDARYGRSCLPAQDACVRAVAAAVPRVPRQAVRVVDIGCGTGVLLERLAGHWADARLIGVDPAERMLAVARGRLPAARFLSGEARQLPLGDSSVDVVVSTASFGHWRDQSAGLGEVARVLAPGGTAFIVEHLPPTAVTALLFRLAGRLPDYRSIDEMDRLARGAGLGVLRCARVPGGYVELVARKREPTEDSL